MSTPARLRRVDTMLTQLNQSSEEYATAREEFDSARIEFEVKREKFATVRRLAQAVLSSADWWHWRAEHENVQFTGLKIGEAIAEALENHAYGRAFLYHQQKSTAPFRPTLTLEQLQEAMERGGFEFRTTTPLREVNAALINLEGVRREADGYMATNADEILKLMAPDPKPQPPRHTPPVPIWETDEVAPEPDPQDWQPVEIDDKDDVPF
jgi:hypothetical protein